MKPPSGTTFNSKVIRASREVVYKAFTDPDELVLWLAPGDMKAKLHHFDLRVGGGYQMSLFYSPSQKESQGKTSEKEDRYTARFLELCPPSKIVQVTTFDSENPSFLGEMRMEVMLEPEGAETRVTIVFKNIPSGIQPEDNEKGTQMALEKLAKLLERP